MDQPNYFSAEFYAILTEINRVLCRHGVSDITTEQGIVQNSKFNTGRYGNTLMWRITHFQKEALFNSKLMSDMYFSLQRKFPQYAKNKVISIGNPSFTASSVSGNPIASIVIMITELDDNVITRADIDRLLAKDPEATKKCLEIESRMYRRENDQRCPLRRLFDFAFSLIYEPKLVELCADGKLIGVTDLKLQHQVEAVLLEPDTLTDFTGIIADKQCAIEAKATKDTYVYNDTEVGHTEFAAYIIERISSGSLGSLHAADYAIIVFKSTGDVVIFEVQNPENNWLAGKLILEDYYED